MNIVPAIVNVIKKHERMIIDKGLEIDGKNLDQTTFVQLMREKSAEQRDLYFTPKVNPYKIDVYKLCYLAKYVPSTTISTAILIRNWNMPSFIQWIDSIDNIGICSLGSGPGSDIFGCIYGILNKTNHTKKVQYVVRNELVPTWEHFYQWLKKELITEDFIKNGEIVNENFDFVKNENETMSQTLKLCFDEWISSQSDEWASALSYSKCNILTMQHVISDPETDEDKAAGVDREDMIQESVMKIVKHSARPLIILVSDIEHPATAAKINRIKDMLAQVYKLTEIKPLAVTDQNIGVDLTNYIKQFDNYLANYSHNQAIWRID